MIDAVAAEEIARTWVAQVKTERQMQLELRAALTEEHEFGWVFHYGKSNVPASPSPADLLVGPAPVIVDRRNGTVHPLPSGLPKAVCIEIYARTGQLPKLPLRPPLDQYRKRHP